MTLAGKTLGFATSVIGRGGSEVLFAGAVEAAVAAGAEAVVWSYPEAVIREHLRGISVTYRDWPGTVGDGGTTHSTSFTQNPPPSPPCKAREGGMRSLTKAALPFAVKRWLGFRRDARRFAAELAAVKPDLFVVNVNGSEAASCAGLLAGVPVVNIYHLSYTDPPGTWLARRGDHHARRKTLHAAAMTIHTSNAVRNEWTAAYGAPTGPVKVIYNGVTPAATVDRAAIRAGLGIAENIFVFAVPGRLDPIKGHAVLLEALAGCRAELAGCTILICGDGPLRESLEAQSRERGLSSIIRFLGWRDDLPAILAASDAVVLPSVASENLSVAVLEGLMAGTPAIVTDIGGMAEAVIDGVTGRVVPRGDAPVLARAMLDLLRDPNATKQMGVAARKNAQSQFTRERMSREYAAAFAEALA